MFKVDSKMLCTVCYNAIQHLSMFIIECALLLNVYYMNKI